MERERRRDTASEEQGVSHKGQRNGQTPTTRNLIVHPIPRPFAVPNIMKYLPLELSLHSGGDIVEPGDTVAVSLLPNGNLLVKDKNPFFLCRLDEIRHAAKETTMNDEKKRRSNIRDLLGRNCKGEAGRRGKRGAIESLTVSIEAGGKKPPTTRNIRRGIYLPALCRIRARFFPEEIIKKKYRDIVSERKGNDDGVLPLPRCRRLHRRAPVRLAEARHYQLRHRPHRKIIPNFQCTKLMR